MFNVINDKRKENSQTATKQLQEKQADITGKLLLIFLKIF